MTITTVETDGRDIDLRIAELTGEAAKQKISHPERPHVTEAAEWRRLPEPDRDDPTYYDRPLLKEPVWKWDIPLYYYIGGAAGASLVIGAAAQLDGSPKFHSLIRRAHLTGIIGSAASGALLIHDLGMPSRFHHMLRVFRPTSPMNVGVWILSAVAPSALVAALLTGRRGFLGKFGFVSGMASGIAGLGLSTYTGVLVANTAVPIWQEGRNLLPILFGASAMASAGSLFDMAFENPVSRRVTYTFGTLGRAAELASTLALEAEVSRKSPYLAKPLKTGASGAMWKTATVLTAASLGLSLLPGRSKRKRLIAGLLGTAGSLLMRFGIHQAGIASSRDPRSTFRQQRA
jgi:formate-dependent nitrite reductase membrane component NrfD